ncbi:hypothetical protein VNI00_006717 [Paramarasmius palmivorus]|uniref:MYND-type domain-containing protein n=1 Tax=Paramarasmius palmivorus TaxID=297713 RepID=A0AAW0DA28_9AGAR
MIHDAIAQWAIVESVNTFLKEGSARFNTPRRAVSTLRSQFPRPPSAIDISEPSNEVCTVLQALACLACYITPAHPLAIQTRNHRDTKQVAQLVESNWDSCIGPWIMFYIERFLLADTGPSTRRGQEVLDVIAYMIPLLFMYPALCTHSRQAVEQLKHTSPDFPITATRAMITLVEKDHFTWGSWAAALGSVQYYGSGSEVFVTAMVDAALVYQHNVALIYVQHLHRECQRAYTPSQTIDFHGMRCMMLSFAACIHPDSPLYIPFIIHGGVHKLVKLLTTVICRRKTLQHIPSKSKKLEDPHAVIAVTIVHLGMSFARSPTTVCDVIDGGLIMAIFKANRFYEFEESIPPDGNRGELVSESFADILETISIFFVYPSVLHRFLNAAKRVVDLGLLDTLATGSRRLIEVWKKCHDLARNMHQICRRMKARGLSRCGYSKCPMQIKGKPPCNVEITRYFRCSACRTITYCSRNCARLSWKEFHREQCQKLIDDGKFLRGHPAHVDTIFQKELIRTYIHRHKPEVYEAITNFIQQNTSGFWQIIGVPRIVVVLDFCRSDFMSANAITIFDLENLLTKDARLANFSEQVSFISQVDEAALRENRILVVTFVPSVGSGYGQDRAWPVGVDTIPASWSSGDDSDYSDDFPSDSEGCGETGVVDQSNEDVD